MPQLFSPQLTWAASGPRIVANVGPAYEIWMHEGARVIAGVRRAVTPRAPTSDDVRLLYPNGMRMRGGSVECTASPEEVAEELGVADVFPAVHGLALLSDGTIWVERVPSRGDLRVVDVFAPDGAYAGTMRDRSMPVAVMPGGDLLVPREDEDSGGTVLTRVKVTR